MNIQKKLISAILCLCMIMSFSPVSAEEAISEEQSPNQVELAGSPYSVVICDDAELLDEQGRADVLEMMRSVSEYANVGFLTYPSGGSSQNSAAKAMNWGNETFGSNTRFTVFIIDMTNRHLDIYASQPLSGILTSAAETSIADNVYRYASRGEYSDCAVETFRLILNVLKDEKATSDAFVFRGNITWGMSEKEIISREGNPQVREMSNDYLVVGYENVPISRYQGDLGYILLSDKLMLSMYGIHNPDQEMFDYMKRALNAVYGDEVEASSQEFSEVLSELTEEEFEIDDTRFCKWIAQEDTVIYLAYEHEILYVAYISPEMANLIESKTKENAVVTTGL